MQFLVAHPSPLQKAQQGYLGWGPACGTEYSVSNAISYGQCKKASQARCSVLSCSIHSPHGQNWNGHISASNWDRALIFYPYERFFQSTFRILQFCCNGNISLAIISAKSQKIRKWLFYSGQNRIFSVHCFSDWLPKQKEGGHHTSSCLKHHISCFNCGNQGGNISLFTFWLAEAIFPWGVLKEFLMFVSQQGGTDGFVRTKVHGMGSYRPKSMVWALPD